MLDEVVGIRGRDVSVRGRFLAVATGPRTACLIADVNMPGMSGLDLHRHLSTSGKRIPTILITAYPDNGVSDCALNAGVICYLSKPFDEGDLLSCIHSALPSDRL